MRGFAYIPSSIGLECLLFPAKWFTCAMREGSEPSKILAQIDAVHGCGRILWMLPADEDHTSMNNKMLDHLAFESGQRGLFHLTAIFDEYSQYLDTFRESGYTQIGWEQVWQYSWAEVTTDLNIFRWRKTTSTDLHTINLLQNKILFPQEKPIEISVFKIPPQYCLEIDGTIRGYSYVNVGLEKVFLTPYIDQDIQSSKDAMDSLIEKTFSNKLCVYILQRSNQVWLNSYLLERCKNVSEKRLRMVKHLTVRNEEVVAKFNHVPNRQHADIITPTTKVVKFKDRI